MGKDFEVEAVTPKLLLSLAIPAALSVLLNNAFKVIDQYSVQWLGVEAQAAVGSTTFIMIGLFAIFALIAAGTGPLTARATGARDKRLRRLVFANSIVWASIIGLTVFTVSGLIAPWIAGGVGLKNGALVAATTYLRWLAVFGWPLVLSPVIDAVLIALGKTTQMMLLQILATVLNVVLNPFLIYAADLGIAGAAVATGLSRGVSVTFGLFLLWRIIQPRGSDFYPNQVAFRIMRIGLPICWNTGLFALVYWALLKIAVSPLGPSVNAALGIGFSALEGFTWPLFWGFSMAVAGLVGRNIGANRIDQALRTIRIAFPIVSVLGLSAGLIFWFAAELLCNIFTDNESVLEQAVLYANILAFSQLFVAYESLAEGVLEGSGDTRPIFFWSAPLNFLRVPLGWLAAIPFGFGAAGIWWVINITTFLKAWGKWNAVKKGRWKSLAI